MVWWGRHRCLSTTGIRRFLITWLTMNVFAWRLFFYALIASLLMAKPASGQHVLQRKISLTVSNKALRVVLVEIETIADVRFLYQSSVVSSANPVSLRAQNELLGKVLARLLHPLKIHFETDGDYIILTKVGSATGAIKPSILTRPTLKAIWSSVSNKGQSRGRPCHRHALLILSTCFRRNLQPSTSA